ncbi:MAG: spore coat U domain-containing protein [Hyphomicrobiales bacterium]|nr:spore coat U domain-containing protein [Hyphomicrobiales bacterium]
MVACTVAGVSPASAQTCTVTGGSGTYVSSGVVGGVDVLSGAAISAVSSAPVVVNCTGAANRVVRACVELGVGNNYQASLTQRSLAGANAGLVHDFYTNAAHSTIWGAWGTYFYPYGPGGVQVDVTLGANGKGASAAMPIYGLIAANQQTVPPGTYTWTTASPGLEYAYLGTTPCPLTNGVQIATSGATWTANVIKNCLLTPSPLNFGAVSVLTSAVTASTTLGVQCTNTTPYSVGLDGGVTAGTGASPTARQLAKGAARVTYGLYQDAAHATPWGNTSANWVAGTGTGLVQNYAIYGQVPAQTTPASGAYSDTVTVTVTF